MSNIVIGNLVDVWCWESNNGIALDTGADLTQDPGAHSVHSLYEVDFCRNSGFIIVRHHPAGDLPYEVESTLDQKGNLLVVDALQHIDTSATNCMVKATGILSSKLAVDQSPVLITSSIDVFCEQTDPEPFTDTAANRYRRDWSPNGLGMTLFVVALITLFI